MTNSDMTPQASRMSYQDFSDAAPFGKTNLANIVDQIGYNWPLRSDILEKMFMPIWHLFHLHAQSIVLNAFLEHMYLKFPSINMDKEIQSKIKAAIYSFNLTQPHNQDQSVSLLSSKIKTLQKTIIQNLKEILARPTDHILPTFPQNWNEKEFSAFKQALRILRKTISTKLEELQKNLEAIKNPVNLEYDTMKYCLTILEQQHTEGRKLVQAFFEYGENTLPIVLVIPKLAPSYDENMYLSEKQRSKTLNTRKDSPGSKGERHIQFTFSPQRFHCTELLRLPLEFFHEYISHLVAGIYKKSMGQFFWDIPMEMDEGWMMYTAKVFFEEEGLCLLGNSYNHLEAHMTLILDNWVFEIASPDGKLYFPEVEVGVQAARKFLKFLQNLPKTKEHAKKLFYRFSFDLITRYPLSEVWHVSFILRVDSLLQRNQALLAHIVSECLQLSTEGLLFINLDCFWSCLEKYQSQAQRRSVGSLP